MITRIFVEKKQKWDNQASILMSELKDNLYVNIDALRILNFYDIENMDPADYELCRDTVFFEPNLDYLYEESYLNSLLKNPETTVFATKYLPGQYDQRADSAMQCVQIITQKESPVIETGKFYVLEGSLTKEETEKIKSYFINPVETMEIPLTKPERLKIPSEIPPDIEDIEGFAVMDNSGIMALRTKLQLAMSDNDLLFCRDYFKKIDRNPTMTEIKVIDTYWSDHCRHTTFLTTINSVEFADSPYKDLIEKAFISYLRERDFVYGENRKDICLMDIAVMGMKSLKKRGLLQDLDESEEINACSIEIDADIDGKTEKWLLMFKNETHNHPTEIEPFGGAATCLGGAIRDPLSGRSFVYQAMRITGSGDPRTSVAETIPGKLPQIKITTGAAAGYSSYGNQIGLTTGLVKEIYDDGFVAKRMELGAVIAAAPKENVVRERPQKTDLVILVGGRTGRDGCGGATGSSKEHTEESILNSAEVQKGNPPTERHIQRLFKNPAASKLIKRCNDFGAGGVSVAIGELADGLNINLDNITKKYDGLNGTELAISESQERMAVVVGKNDAGKFIDLANAENLEAVVVAEVTDDRTLTMTWRGKTIVSISRDFLDTNGAKQETGVFVGSFESVKPEIDSVITKEKWLGILSDLNVCSQKGLVERFDPSVGAATVLYPYGGKYQLTPAEAMAAKLPVEGETTTVSLMTFGYNPKIAEKSPFHGAAYAVVESVSKIVASGGDYKSTRLSFQEYFEKMNSANNFGKPFSALLGALDAQLKLGTPSIGGKDSMSGTFKELNVPPTLVSFAVNVSDVNNITSPEFKNADSAIVLVKAKYNNDDLPDYEKLKDGFDVVTKLIRNKKVVSASTIGHGGLCAAISKMAFGNKIAFTAICEGFGLYNPGYGSFLLEYCGNDTDNDFAGCDYEVVGKTLPGQICALNGLEMDIDELIYNWSLPLEKIFPTRLFNTDFEKVHLTSHFTGDKRTSKVKYARPRVFLPNFPGTNCEMDMNKSFVKAGAETFGMVVRNLSVSDLEESILQMAKEIKRSQILAFSGGFSAGDEPDGSGKFITAMFKNPYLKEAINDLLERDGLIIGICNGFQALVKLGLVPFGEIREITPESPTLAKNEIGRHISGICNVKVTSTNSPWLQNVECGEVYKLPLSHGEGRFIIEKALAKELFSSGQVVSQYVDDDFTPTMNIRNNPNGSLYAIEGIVSPDGRILGRMGHPDRISDNIYKNVPGYYSQKIFASGVEYFG